MNDFSELEAELKKLRPAAASAELQRKVGDQLSGYSDRSAAERNAAEESRRDTFVVVPRDPATTPPASLGTTEELRRHRPGRNWLPLGLALAAAAGFLLLARLNVDQPISKAPAIAAASPAMASPSSTSIPNTTADDSNFVPSGVTQVVYNTRDEGLHFAQGAERPVRRVRSKKRETLQWHNPETGASLRVSYPSEEVTLTPISGQ